MAGLSQELVTRCYDIFSRCGEFESHQKLKAVFVTEELAIYQDGLREASSKSERVSLTIDYLRLRFLRDGRPVFPFFIAELRRHYEEGDSLWDELETLRQQIQQRLSGINTIEVPFVVMAMTQAEVAELQAETFFARPEIAPIEHARFEQLRQSLLSHQIEHWAVHYQPQRDAWKPHATSEYSIDDIIVSIVDHINRCEREPNELPIIRRRSFSEEFFAQAPNPRRATWDYLRQSGGVLIIDAISLFHPHLRHLLIQSGITSEDKVAIMVLSPLNSSTFAVNTLIETLMKEQMETMFLRFHERLDRLCEIGDGNVRCLQRWLFAKLPQTAEMVKEQTIITNRRFIRQLVQPQTGSIDQAIFRIK